MFWFPASFDESKEEEEEDADTSKEREADSGTEMDNFTEDLKKLAVNEPKTEEPSEKSDASAEKSDASVEKPSKEAAAGES